MMIYNLNLVTKSLDHSDLAISDSDQSVWEGRSCLKYEIFIKKLWRLKNIHRHRLLTSLSCRGSLGILFMMSLSADS